MSRARVLAASGFWLAFAALAPGCGGSATAAHEDIVAATRLPKLHGTRYLWVEADCNDGALDLARLGFERELHVEVDDGALLMTFDTALATSGCSATSVLRMTPANQGELWNIEPQALVTTPFDGDCGAAERAATLGSLRVSGDLLELELQRSDWCRGFDARFVYRRTEATRLDDRQLVARYVAHYNRADAAALAQLFVDGGSLIEPFTRTDDGNFKRHEGRAQVRDWFAGAFASAPWHALRLLALTPGTSPGHVTAEWEYMDARLSAPLSGRNLFVIAGGEIYETEIQLVSDPKPISARAEAR